MGQAPAGGKFSNSPAGRQERPALQDILLPGAFTGSEPPVSGCKQGEAGTPESRLGQVNLGLSRSARLAAQTWCAAQACVCSHGAVLCLPAQGQDLGGGGGQVAKVGI